MSESKEDLESLFLIIHRYRHLLVNLASQRRKLPSKVKADRPAAVLARLWAEEDLELRPCSQSRVGRDLGLDASAISQILGDLRKPGASGEGCVKLASDPMGRSRIYEITDTGKRELEKYLQATYAPEQLNRFIREISPKPTKVTELVEGLKGEVKKLLGD